MVFCLCGVGERERGKVDGVCGRGAHDGVGSFRGIFGGGEWGWRGLEVLYKKGSWAGVLTNQSHVCDICTPEDGSIELAMKKI